MVALPAATGSNFLQILGEAERPEVVLFEPANGRRVVQLPAKRALEDAEMRGGAGGQCGQPCSHERRAKRIPPRSA